MTDTRREFLKQAGHVSALGLAGRGISGADANIAIVVDGADALVSGPPVQWAIGRLRQAIEAKGARAQVVNRASAAPALGPEAFSLSPGRVSGKPSVAVSASDTCGLVYGLLELTDRVRFGGNPLNALAIQTQVNEKPANRVRSIARAFVSEVEDKPWYYDKEFWREYLTALAGNRFNRFTMTFGLGYDFPRGVTGDYFHFAYPYLVDVPGYKVRVVPLPDDERERNLETLKFIGRETALRGLHFQLALWTHAYKWTDSPNAQHRIVGLTPETHGPYCRDAMAMLLKEVPEIEGVTMRVHGESGIPEGSTGFWRDVFDGIIRGGRRTSIDMHAKGIDRTMMELALQTGLPVSISPKYWAEHMGLGYHQAAIRELEMPRAEDDKPGIFKLSEGSRRFLRYGYGDLFKAGRRYEVTFRIWPGTQRLLVWGDPASAAAYGRASSFCGASGVEIFEPLFFKGRQGSGLPGGRCAYADESLKPKFDFEKYLYTYRVWGRLLYDPEADPESWRRYLRAEFGAAAASVEDAVTHGSRVLPLFTTARLPSASNLGCWPEMYTNMPIVEGSEPSPYADTAVPKRLGTVSPLDPQLFSTVEEFAFELLSLRNSGKYSPIEVAQWLEDTSDAAVRSLTLAASRVPARKAPGFRRIEEDVLIEAGMGRFFAAQIRSAVLFDWYRRTSDGVALEQAVSAYRKARSAWASMAERARGVYRADVTFGDTPVRRGHWIDRLHGIDKDLAAMEALAKGISLSKADREVPEAMWKPARVAVPCGHESPSSFLPGDVVPLSIKLPETVRTATLKYRRVDQAERWQTAEMQGKDRGIFQSEIPGDYTKSPFALQYYFELRRSPAVAWLYPGFNADRTNQPYFVIARMA